MPFLRREALGGNIACHNHGRAKCGEQIFSRPWGGYSWNLTWFPRLFIFFVWLVVIPSNIYCPDVRGSGNCPLLFLRVSLDHTPLYPYAHRNFIAVRTLQWRRSLEVEWVLKNRIHESQFLCSRVKRNQFIITWAQSNCDSWLLFLSTHSTSKLRPHWRVHAPTKLHVAFVGYCGVWSVDGAQEQKRTGLSRKLSMVLLSRWRVSTLCNTYDMIISNTHKYIFF